MAAEWIVFYLTDRCQLACEHCLRDPGRKPLDLPVPLIIDILDQARSLYNTSHISLTGGEPTLHPQFLDVIDAAVARGFTWHMVSNGSRFGRVLARLDEKPERLEKMTLANFSLDGATEETHDAIRGPGSFRSVMEAAALCHTRGIDFLFQMVVNGLNFHEVEDVAMLAGKLGATALNFSPSQPTGTASDEKLFLPISDWRSIRDQAERMRCMFSFQIALTVQFPKERPFHICESYNCRVLAVDVDGRMNLCCQLTGIPSEGEALDDLGDLNEISLAQGHQRMLDRIHDLTSQRLETMRRGELTEWDTSPCNWCLRVLGKPHWTPEGAAGPKAKQRRERTS